MGFKPQRGLSHGFPPPLYLIIGLPQKKFRKNLKFFLIFLCYTLYMDYLLMAAAVCVIIALIAWYIKYFNKKNQKSTRQKNLQPVKCPLCDSNLFVGENIISKVYRPMNVPDQLMIVMGCPHCYPRCEPGLKRICPVCHKEVAQDQSLTARLFNKALGKKHVHVVGCSNCHKPRAD